MTTSCVSTSSEDLPNGSGAGRSSPDTLSRARSAGTSTPYTSAGRVRSPGSPLAMTTSTRTGGRAAPSPYPTTCALVTTKPGFPAKNPLPVANCPGRWVVRTYTAAPFTRRTISSGVGTTTGGGGTDSAPAGTGTGGPAVSTAFGRSAK